MSNLKLKTASGGSVQLTPTDTASNVVLTLPASNTALMGEDTFLNLGDYANDAPAAVLVGGLYRNGTIINVRVV